MSEIENNQILEENICEIIKSKPNRISFSRLSDKSYKYIKIKIVKIKKEGNDVYSFEKYTEKQVFHSIVKQDDLFDLILEEMSYFKQINADSIEYSFDMRITKKGKILFSKRKNDMSKVKKEDNNKLENINICTENLVANTHNHKKKYILDEGMYIPAFIDLGIFTKDGKIVNSKYDKFKQINRFIEIIDDGIKKLDSTGYIKESKQIKILDFGCGKSYLTFILYYYLTTIKKLDAYIIGLDLKKDVIEHCNEIANKYKYENLRFEVGDISNYKYTDNIDIVITLHACDTATDYALFNAIKWNAKMIFSVPCCQHEINSTIKSEEFGILTKYGIVKERVSSLFTDSIRASLLEVMGYKTQILEFVDISHSPKNMLIRAFKTNVNNEKRKKSLKEVEDLRKYFSFEQTLYTLLKKENMM